MARPIQVYDEKSKKFVWRNEYQCQGEACEQWVPIKEAGKIVGGRCGRKA
jgi:hypothetical protein